MSSVLAKSLRPKSFDHLYGQAELVRTIRRQIASTRIPQVWIFEGESGSGKTTIARILAMALNCPHKKKFGEYCKECYPINKSINKSEVDAVKYRTVEDATSLVEIASSYPIPPDKYRIFILDEAHKLTDTAQNIFLKPFEEAAKTTVWIICTTEINKIIKPLRRRCMTFSLAPLKHKEVEQFIKWAAGKAEIERKLDDFIAYVHEERITSAGIILNLLEKYGAGMDPDKAASGSANAVNGLSIAKNMAAGEWNLVRPELDKCTPDAVRWLRGQILGYMNHQLMQRTPSMSRKLIVEAIEKLADISYGLDEVSQLALLSARVHILCGRFEKG